MLDRILKENTGSALGKAIDNIMVKNHQSSINITSIFFLSGQDQVQQPPPSAGLYQVGAKTWIDGSQGGFIVNVMPAITMRFRRFYSL